MDSVLIVRLNKGSKPAFKELYDKYAKDVFLYTCKIVKSEVLAEDIVQDVFLKIWENAETIDADQPFKYYLLSVTKNHILNILRRGSKEKEIITTIISTAEQQLEEIECKLDYKESNEIIEKAISQLPIERKRIFELCKKQDYSYKEVSDLLNLSESTVNSQMVKALKFVRGYYSSSCNTLFWQLLMPLTCFKLILPIISL